MGLHRRPKEPRGGTARRAVATGSVIGALGTGVVLADAQGAVAASSTVWDRLAQCESSGNFRNADTGHNGHYGGFQFSPATWRSVGGSGSPANASVAEQLKRAKILLAQPGSITNKWVCAPQAGLTRAAGAAQGLSVLGGAVKTLPRAQPAPATSTAAAKAVSFARAQLGKPYVYGGTGPHAWDCSGLTQAAWRAAGITLPRVALAQFRASRVVAPSEIRPGDLVVYLGGAHIAIYIGGGKIIEAPSPGHVVRTAPFRTGWYATHFTAVVRPGGAASRTPSHARPKVVVPVPRTVVKTGGTYKIRTGDWLAKVARAHNVRGGWQALYALNKGAVGPDPDLVHAGLRIKLG